MPDTNAFLLQHKTIIEHMPQIPTVVKKEGYTLTKVTNIALNKVGLGSAKLEFAGVFYIRPLPEAYYSQTPLW